MTEAYTVDLKRHNDGEDGLVGPFNSRDEAQQFIDTIHDDFEREYATIRPVQPGAICEFCLTGFLPEARDGVAPFVWANYCRRCESDGRAALIERNVSTARRLSDAADDLEAEIAKARARGVDEEQLTQSEVRVADLRVAAAAPTQEEQQP